MDQHPRIDRPALSELTREAPWAAPVSPIGVANFVLRSSRWLVGGAVLGGALFAVATLATRSYVAESRFTPQSSSGGQAQIAGLAAQFGFNVGGSGDGESIDFYVQLLKSRELLTQLAGASYPASAADTTRRPYMEIAEVGGATPDERLQRAVGKLGKAVTVARDAKANLVTVRTTAATPALAVALNAELLERVNAFNLEKRQTRAVAEREFVETRMRQARTELDAAEAELEAFLTRNRAFQGSPQLTFDRERLGRRVELRQKIYLTLTEAYEKARIEEVRNTPLITVIDRPAGSAEPSSSIVKSTAIGVILGGALALGLAFVREYLRIAAGGTGADASELRSLLHGFRPFRRRVA